jgi:glycosyltransferase involved in cell wall biosynthesis
VFPHKLRVVHIVSGDQWAGAEVMQSSLLSRLVRLAPSCELAVICLNHGELARRLQSAGVDVTVLPETTLSFAQILTRARRLLAARRPDVLHSHRYKEHYLAAVLAPFLRARTVATIHGLPEPAHKRRWRYALQAAMTFRLLRSRFDRIVAVSADLRRQLVGVHGCGESSVDVVTNGITIPELVHVARTDASFHVGSVGRFVKVKGFEMFLDTAALVLKQYPHARFSLLGDGPDRELLLRRAETLGIASRVNFVAPTTNPQSYFESLDLYVNTSEHEGLPLTVLEAMAHGVPVVAPNVGGIPEVVRSGEEGVLVAARQPADFAAAIVGLLADEAGRSRISRAGRERVVAAFSADAMALRYGQLYADLAGTNRPTVSEQ